MKYVDEFRNPRGGKGIVADIERLVAKTGRTRNDPLKIMEICGGHTHAIFKFGLQSMLPDALELVHGPGCPVCVLPVGRVDDALSLATQRDVIFASFGDAIRVPGSRGSLLEAKAEGADVRTVYSPSDALDLARQNSSKRVIFFGLGFETTVPSTALTVLEAAREDVDNFLIFSNHITIVPTLRALLDTDDLRLDGFIGPGHVSMVIGVRPYDFVAAEYHKPFIVSGFEPLDVLQSLRMLLAQLVDGRVAVENQYRRLVQDDGNRVALEAMAEVFEPRDTFEWRGLGTIPQSGLQLRAEYARFDAESVFTVPAASVPDHSACECGEVLKGAIKPWECKVFGTACTPETPIGACMVSSEGACAAHYNYGRLTPPALRTIA